MEEGANNRSGFSVSDKKSPFCSDVCLTKLQSSQPLFSSKSYMNMGFLHRLSDCPGDGGGGGFGPICGGANEAVADYRYLHNASTYRGGAEKLTRTNFEPSDILPYCSNKSTGVMAASVGFPFTFAQWKELERQAMIYKYMIASVPVPPDLLFPLSRNLPDSSATLAGGDLYNARYTSKRGDPEPGRCKRTDGKKWRCSRDVAPHQKYCERHLHRGRPRSRKPVELKNNGETQKKPRLEQISLPTTVQANSHASQQFAAAYRPQMLYIPKPDLSVSTPSSKGTNRDLGLMIESGMATFDGTQQQIASTNESSSLYDVHQDYSEQQLLNLLPYSNFSSPSRFVGSWSTDDTSVENVMGHGRKILDDSRNSSPVSWEPFPHGGPLAEALQLGSVPTSPYRSISTPPTTMSSPSGVIHTTLFSNSDSSVCNSPTLAATTFRTCIPLV